MADRSAVVVGTARRIPPDHSSSNATSGTLRHWATSQTPNHLHSQLIIRIKIARSKVAMQTTSLFSYILRPALHNSCTHFSLIYCSQRCIICVDITNQFPKMTHSFKIIPVICNETKYFRFQYHICNFLYMFSFVLIYFRWVITRCCRVLLVT